MHPFITSYLVSFVVFLAIDAVWLGVIATNMYKTYIGHLMGPVNFWAAGAFYVLYIAGLTYFITYPAQITTSKTVAQVALQGALLSGLCYATYDLTNQATLKNWPWHVTLIDITWGFVLGGFVCGLSYWLLTKFA